MSTDAGMENQLSENETMQDLIAPLNDNELDQLDQLLLNRIDEDADVDDADEGVLDVSELDGFFTAIASGPTLIPPSRWLPSLWGAFEPAWASHKEAEEVTALLIRQMNSISGTLMEHPDEFEPMFLEREMDGETYTVVDEWCQGYLRGVALAADQWKKGGPEIVSLLAPIRSFTSETDWRAHDLPTDIEIEKLRDTIAPNVRAIHVLWLARRNENAPQPAPSRGAKPRVGRNEPCPCGSGKQFKDCCLH